MASYGDELVLDSSFPWSDVFFLSSFSIPLSFIFQETKKSIDEEDPRPTSSNGAYIILEYLTFQDGSITVVVEVTPFYDMLIEDDWKPT